jgi:cytochrome c oxidase subunit 2
MTVLSALPWLPPVHSAHGAVLDEMLVWVHWLMGILFVGWGIFFLYTLFRFAKGRHPKASYTGFHGHKFSLFHESGVAVIEIILLVGFAFPLWAKVKAVPPPETGTVQVHVIGEQFAWNVHYPGPDGEFGKRDLKLVTAENPIGLDRNDASAKDDITTINQLHLPVDKTAFIRLSSKDVIHSFSLPVMRVKQDAIPGMSIPLWFEPIVAGKSEIACAQLCGLGHYRMRGYLEIHEPGGFEKWLEEQGAELKK